MIQGMFLGLDLYYTDPAQHLITAGQDLDGLDRNLSDLSDLDRDLSDLSVRRVEASWKRTLASGVQSVCTTSEY